MGYPMTYRRVVARNGLSGESPGATPDYWSGRVNIFSMQDHDATVGTARAEAIRRLEGQAALLASDLRRLEHDAVDERVVCGLIARQTNVDEDDVAAVLAAFFALV